MAGATAEAPLETALGNFMAITAKSTVAVVVPLYGYWNDIVDNPVNGEVLNAILKRVYSNVHHLLFVFVANPQSIEHDQNNPESVGNILIARTQAGNVLNVAVDRSASYAEYIEEGIDAALKETKAQFVVVINPWVLIQDGSIDVLIDRANFGDSAKIVCGFDVREAIEPENFDRFKTSTPKEELDLSFNLLAMPRFVAEMLQLDPELKTHRFVERDIWQRMVSKGFDAITSQRIPIFPFEFPWTDYETREQHEADKAHFSNKWQFDPGIKHE